MCEAPTESIGSRQNQHCNRLPVFRARARPRADWATASGFRVAQVDIDASACPVRSLGDVAREDPWPASSAPPPSGCSGRGVGQEIGWLPAHRRAVLRTEPKSMGVVHGAIGEGEKPITASLAPVGAEEELWEATQRPIAGVCEQRGGGAEAGGRLCGLGRSVRQDARTDEPTQRVRRAGRGTRTSAPSALPLPACGRASTSAVTAGVELTQ
jgi:hypothetical protein